MADACAPQVRDLVLIPTADNVVLDLALGAARLASEWLSRLALLGSRGFKIGFGFGFGISFGYTALARVVDRDPD